MRSTTDVGRMGLRSGLCAGQSSSSSPNYLFMDLALCIGALSCSNGKGCFQTVAIKLEAHYCLKYHSMLHPYDFTKLETRGLNQTKHTCPVCGQGCPYTFGHTVNLQLHNNITLTTIKKRHDVHWK